MTPLENYWDLKRGYRFGQKTFYTKHHLGVDLVVRRGTPIYAPCGGFVKNEWGKEGGYQAHLITDTHYYRFLHLSKYGKKGEVTEGDIIGYSGNTGLTTGPHCHHDIYDLSLGEFNIHKFQNFIDPDKFYLDTLGQKKNMKMLLIIDNSLVYEGLAPYLKYVKDFWADLIEIKMLFRTLKIDNVPFIGDKISRSWLAQNIVPYASGYDALCLWLPPEKWANFDNEKTIKAYTVPDKILGVQVMCMATTVGSTDTRWHDIPNQNDVAGKLRHELSHALNRMTKGVCNVNNSPQFIAGDDNTHYYDFVVKDLSQVKKDIPIYQFEGWTLRAVNGQYAPIRLFKYATPTKKHQIFSGIYEIGRLYKSSDNRMFFTLIYGKENAGKLTLDWKLLTEEEFNEEIKTKPYTIISVAEANYIMFIFFDNQIPERTKIIREEIVYDPLRYNWLRLLGWSPEIPTKYLT